MDQQYRPMPGTPVEDLETPCLILDMDALDHNMDVMADFYEGRDSKLRPHSKNHKTPAWPTGRSAGAGQSVECARPKFPRPKSWSTVGYPASSSPARSPLP